MVVSPVRPGVTPERVLALDTAYRPSNVVLGAVELGVFSAIAARPATAEYADSLEGGLFGRTATPLGARA